MTDRKSQTQEAINSLVQAHRLISSPSPIPRANPEDKNSVLGLLVALMWAGDYSQFGYANALIPAIEQMAIQLGEPSIRSWNRVEDNYLKLAILTCAQAIPDLSVAEAINMLFRVLEVPHEALFNHDEIIVRDVIEWMFKHSHIAAQYALVVLGFEESRPRPSESAAILSAHIGLMDFTDFLLPVDDDDEDSFEQLRVILCDYSFESYLAIHYFSRFCPNHCEVCPALLNCEALMAGVV